jgi:hypothetical protein
MNVAAIHVQAGPLLVAEVAAPLCASPAVACSWAGCDIAWPLVPWPEPLAGLWWCLLTCARTAAAGRWGLQALQRMRAADEELRDCGLRV